jgi:hypothetical protein
MKKMLFAIALFTACAVEVPIEQTSTASSSEIDCDPVFGCADGGGGDATTCVALCLTDLECQVPNCFGTTCFGARSPRAGHCTY